MLANCAGMRSRSQRKLCPFLGEARSKLQSGNETRADAGAMVLMYVRITASNDGQVRRRVRMVSTLQREKMDISMSSGRSSILVLERMSHGYLSLREGGGYTACRSD